jgi:hypothetical protein
VLVVPLGTRRAGRIILPPETARWLRDQLIIAIGRPLAPPRAKRQVRLHRGQWRAGR